MDVCLGDSCASLIASVQGIWPGVRAETPTVRTLWGMLFSQTFLSGLACHVSKVCRVGHVLPPLLNAFHIPSSQPLNTSRILSSQPRVWLAEKGGDC